MKLRTIIAGMLGIALAASTLTVLAETYRWTDANGVVHFSQFPPTGQNATTVNDAPIGTVSDGSSNASAESSTPSNDGQSASPTEQTSTKAAPNAAGTKEACAAARSNLAALQSGERIKEKMPDGSTHWLTTAEQAARLKQTNDFLQQHCK